MSGQITEADLTRIIGDAVDKKLAGVVETAMARAREDYERRVKDGDFKGLDISAQISKVLGEERAKGHFAFPGAEGDRSRGYMSRDPHQGRGLVLGQLARIAYLAKQTSRCTPGGFAEVAEEISKNTKDKRTAAQYGEMRASLLESSFSGLGALIPPEMSAEIIEFLYPAVVCQAMGVRTVPFKATLTFGRQNVSTIAYWLGEAQNMTPSIPGADQLELKARTSAVLAPVSNYLLRNPNVATDAFLRDDVVRRMALTRDLAILRGPGTQFQPKGIKNWMRSANQLPATGTSLTDKVADLISLISTIDSADVPMTRAGYVMHPRSKWSLAATLNALGVYVFWPMVATGTLFGFPMATTTQVPINLGGGGGDSEVYFGEWPEVIVGEDTPLEIEMFLNGTYYDGANLVSGISTDQSILRALDRIDVIMRHNQSFAMLTGVQWT